MTFAGVVVGGKVEFDGPAPVPDGTAVRVEVPEPPPAGSFAARYAAVIGTIDGLPADAASRVDEILYGRPG